ncbi:MAG: hypothetical protein NVSMB9_23210 [Isosphaeraceae bacterium]
MSFLPSMALETIKIACIPVSATRCSAVVAQATLLKIAPDPRDLDPKKKGGDDLDFEAQKARDLHNQMQRLFDGEKKNNAVRYTGYLADIRGDAGTRKRDGFAPPISLFSRERLDYITENGEPVVPGKPCYVAIPSDHLLVAFDGDTQLAARHALQREDQTTKMDPVAVTIVHGETVEYAKQAFHDVNAYGVKVSKSLALAMDSSDPITRLTKKLIQRSPILCGRVEEKKPTLRGDDTNIITLSTLQMAVKAFVGGLSQPSLKTVITAETVTEVEVQCIDWFGAIFDRFGDAFNDRTNSVITTQAVMVALGALGHRTYGNKENGFDPTPREVALESLGEVDWSRGDHWEGVALAWTIRKNGARTLSAPNTHSHWRHSYQALSAPRSPLYAKVRRLPEESIPATAIPAAVREPMTV